jgi:ATP/maltotriose-dependent transcriptional regulator MalT
MVKDFELAANLFERKAETWLKQGEDALTILFWLKEIPSVLLISRPFLCWLVALCAGKLGLPLQVKTFLDLAEQNLMALTRFSRSQELWRTIAITEEGVTVGELLQRIENLRII